MRYLFIGLFSLLLFSCGKKGNPNPANAANCTIMSLNARQAFMKVRVLNSPNFKVYLGEVAGSLAVSEPFATDRRAITLTANAANGSELQQMYINIVLPKNSNTVNGDIYISDFSLTGPTYFVNVTLRPMGAEVRGPGTLRITCLTDSGIKGVIAGQFGIGFNIINFDQCEFEARF